MNIYFVSLGCDKNLVDSEMMITSLRKNGFVLTDDIEEADVIVVNTCCFIGDAKEESINTLIEMGSYKDGRCRLLVAAGCLAQRYHNEIKEDIPEVDLIVGTMGYEDLSDKINEALEGNGVLESLKDIDYLPTPLTDRDSMSGGYYAYLKIAEGCDKCCTYCVIPKVRGHYRSVPMDNLIAQAKHLVNNGAKELILVAQETTLYGKDIYGEKSLPKLLDELSKIDELKWIRILYCYPEEITDELIDAIKRNPKVCNYLDMPIQHGADDVLRRMGRWTNREQIENTVSKLRKEIPDIVLRTTLITGFPGETEEEFAETLAFAETAAFAQIHVFKYSRRKGTVADKMPEQLSEQEKAGRSDRLLAVTEQLSETYRRQFIGQVTQVLLEEMTEIDGENYVIGYTSRYVRVAVPIGADGTFEKGAVVFVKLEKQGPHDVLLGHFAE